MGIELLVVDFYIAMGETQIPPGRPGLSCRQKLRPVALRVCDSSVHRVPPRVPKGHATRFIDHIQSTGIRSKCTGINKLEQGSRCIIPGGFRRSPSLVSNMRSSLPARNNGTGVPLPHDLNAYAFMPYPGTLSTAIQPFANEDQSVGIATLERHVNHGWSSTISPESLRPGRNIKAVSDDSQVIRVVRSKGCHRDRPVDIARG